MPDFDIITTKGGDRGETSLGDGSRLSKDHPVIEAMGEIDELHAALGLLKAALAEDGPRDEVDAVQRTLLRMCGLLAAGTAGTMEPETAALEDSQAARLERTRIGNDFVTYGGSETGARADWARAVCRRTERRLVGLVRGRGMTGLDGILRYLNRLSDWLFVLARERDARD